MVGGSSGYSEKRGLAAVAHLLQNQQMGFGSCSRLSFRVTGPLLTPLAMAVLCSLRSLLSLPLAVHCSSPPLFRLCILVLYFALYVDILIYSGWWGLGDPVSKPLMLILPCSARCSRKS